MRFRIDARKLLLALLTATVPVLLGLNVWQGVRYTRLRQDVQRLEEEQIAWFEKNKSLLAAIGIHSSPKRLEALAEGDPESRKSTPELRVRIEPDAASDSRGGSGGR